MVSGSQCDKENGDDEDEWTEALDDGAVCVDAAVVVEFVVAVVRAEVEVEVEVVELNDADVGDADADGLVVNAD